MQIIIYEVDGVVAVVHPAQDTGLTTQEAAAKAVPQGVVFSIQDESALPSDTTFRNSWELIDGAVVENLQKAKPVAHDMRRAERATAFAPHDKVILLKISNNETAEQEAEAQRVLIREADDAKQIAIDAAQDMTELRGAV